MRVVLQNKVTIDNPNNVSLGLIQTQVRFGAWPESIRTYIRDGSPLWSLTDLPCNLRSQRGEPDPESKRQICEKVQKG